MEKRNLDTDTTTALTSTETILRNERNREDTDITTSVIEKQKMEAGNGIDESGDGVRLHRQPPRKRKR